MADDDTAKAAADAKRAAEEAKRAAVEEAKKQAEQAKKKAVDEARKEAEKIGAQDESLSTGEGGREKKRRRRLVDAVREEPRSKMQDANKL